MTAADWQAKYPLLNMEDRGVPTPYDLGLSADREAARWQGHPGNDRAGTGDRV